MINRIRAKEGTIGADQFRIDTACSACGLKINQGSRMKSRKTSGAALLLLLYSSVFFTSCYKGHGLDPDDQLSDRPSGIQGTVTFQGQWPDSTKEVRIAVLKTYPAGLSDPDSLFSFVIENLVVFSDTLPRFVGEYAYEIELRPDLYGWILVAWFPDIESYLFGVKELGAYYQDEGSGIPAPVRVPYGEMVQHINITADFSNIHNNAPFF